MRVTMQEIADIAQVSRATVDKVINNRGGVKPDTKARILKIAKDLNYQPNIVGKALSLQRKSIEIAVLLLDNEFDYLAKSGMEEFVEDYRNFSIDLRCTFTRDNDVVGQLRAIRAVADAGLRFLIIKPLNNPQVREALAAYRDEGGRVVVLNAPLDDFAGFCYVGQDHRQAGVVAGDMMKLFLADRPSPARVAVLMSHNVTVTYQREQGFRQSLRDSGVVIDETVETFEDYIETYDQAKRILQNPPDGIYMTSAFAHRVAEVIRMMELERRVVFVCHDLYEKNREMLEQGVIRCTIGQSPVTQGRLCVKVLFDHLYNAATPEESVLMPMRIYIQSNI